MFKSSSEYGRRFSTSSLPDYRSSMPDLQKVSASSDDGVESQSYKSLLNQLVQKLWKQLPIYQTINEGSDHLPMFRTTVWFNGAGYKSPNTFHLRKMAEMDASRVTYVYMMHKLRIEASRLVHEDKYFCKSILLEYSARMKIEHPTYNTIQLNTPLPIFRCFLDFNDKSWTGDDSWNKKEAEQSAARAAILTYLDSKSGDIMSDIINVKFKRIDGMKGINSAENGLLLDEAKVMKLDNTSAPSGPCLVQDAPIPATVVMNRTHISHGMKNISRAENGLFLDDAKVMKLHDTSAPLEPCLVQDATIPSTMVMNQSQTHISKVPISVPTPVVPVPTVSAQTPFATTKVAPSFSVVSAPPQSANIPATHTPTNVTYPEKSEASSVIPKLPTPPALDPEMYASIMSSKKRRRRNKKNAKKKMRFDDWSPLPDMDLSQVPAFTKQ